MSKEIVTHWLPCPVVFVSTAHGDRRDIMTATAMFVSESSPLLALSLAKGHLTDDLLEASGEFMVAVASEGQRDLAQQVGGAKGQEGDKFDRFSIQASQVKSNKPMIPEGSAAWMQCTLVSAQDVDDSRLVIGQVIDQVDLGNPPLVWQKEGFFRLAPV